MSPLTLSLLGSLEMCMGDDSLDHLRVRSAQALLIFLAVEGRTQQREFLVELLWPGMPLNYGRKNLRQTLYELRRAIPTAGHGAGGEAVPLVIADRQTIALNPQAAVTLDTADFERLARSGDPQNLEQAVALYRGDFLAGFYLPDSSNFEEWVSSRRAAYQRQILDALDELADLALSANDYAKGERFARRQIALDELREPAVRQLMIAVSHQGQRANALQAYGELRERLRNALDIKPAEETTAVYRQIQEESLSRPFEKKDTEDAEETLRARSDWFKAENIEGMRPVHNLPTAMTPFVGRAQELEEIENLLLSADCRLLTLLGSGGAGKSRLALEVAGRLISNDQFSDGIWFVPLAAFEETEQMIPAIAAPLPFAFYGNQDLEQQLLDYLFDKRLVLVLDNMEQLLVSGPPKLLQSIIARAPGVKILATSRASLRVQGEQLYRVDGLTLPANIPHSQPMDARKWVYQFDAVQFFEICARRVDPDFNLDEDNIDAVLTISRHVEGFPLGLEMAAAWIELLTPAEIEEELAQSLDLLEAEWTTPGDRHHSARAVFEWSWRLLTGKEQDLCQTLSLFRGGFSREAALVVGQAKLPALLGLKRKSWLQQDAGGRYQLHELLRQYAKEKLREDEEALQLATAGYAAYFASHFARLAEEARGPQQQETFEAIGHDIDNARFTWHWLVDQRRYADIAGSLLPALFIYASATNRIPEILGLINVARERLADEDAEEEILLATLACNAAECRLQYDYLSGDVYGEVTVSWRLLKEGWDIVTQEPAGFASGPWAIVVSIFYGWQQDRVQGLLRLRGLVKHYRDGGDRWLNAFALQSLGQLLSMQATQISSAGAATIAAEREEARFRLDQALDLFSALGDALEQARTLRWIGHMVQGEDPGMALSYFQEANSLLAVANLPTTPSYASLALSYLSLGEHEEAFRIFAQARRYYEQQGNRALLAEVMSMESMQAARYGDLDHARDLRAACIKIHEELGHEINVIYSTYELGEIDRVSGQLEAAHQLYERALSSFVARNQSHGQAFCRRGLGDLAQQNHEFQLAHGHFTAALELAKKPFVHSWLSCQTQARLARAALSLGDIKMAREHLELAAQLLNFRVVDSNDLLMIALTEMAAFMLIQKEYDKALILGTFVANHPASWHETKWRVEEIVTAAAEELTTTDSNAAERMDRHMTRADALALAGWA